MMQPPDGVGPNEAEEYLRRLARESADQVLKSYQAFLLSDIAPELQRAVVEEIKPLIPSREGMVKEAADALNAKADAGLGDIRARIGQIEDVLKRLAGGDAQAAQTGTPRTNGSGLSNLPPVTIPGTEKKLEVAPWLTFADELFDRFLRYRESASLTGNPLAWAVKLREQNPLNAAIVGQFLNPDAASGEKLAAAIMKVGTELFTTGWRGGASSRQTIREGGGPSNNKSSPPSDGSVSWYGGPSQPSKETPQNPPPQSAAAPQGSATMTNSGSGPEPRDSGQDTVRVSERPGNRQNRSAGLKGNYR